MASTSCVIISRSCADPRRLFVLWWGFRTLNIHTEKGDYLVLDHCLGCRSLPRDITYPIWGRMVAHPSGVGALAGQAFHAPVTFASGEYSPPPNNSTLLTSRLSPRIFHTSVQPTRLHGIEVRIGIRTPPAWTRSRRLTRVWPSLGHGSMGLFHTGRLH